MKKINVTNIDNPIPASGYFDIPIVDANGEPTYNENNEVNAKRYVINGEPLRIASATVLGGVKVGENLSIDENGTLSAHDDYVLPNASSDTLGGVKVGNNLSIDENGVLSAPIASATVLGNIKVGENLSIDDNGVLSAHDSYVLPNASFDTLGGVKVGENLTIDENGVLSASFDVATTTAEGLLSVADKTKLDSIADGATAASFSPTLAEGTKIGTITINGSPTDIYAPEGGSGSGTSGTGSLLVVKPQILAPTDNATEIPTYPTVEISEFSATDPDLVFSAFILQIKESSAGWDEANVYISQTTFVPVTTQLTPGVSYDVRACAQTTDSAIRSYWSNVNTFNTMNSTAYIQAPVVTPVVNQTAPVIKLDPFTLIAHNGETDTQVSITVEIRDHNTAEVIARETIETAGDVAELSTTLENSTVYDFEVWRTGATYGNSPHTVATATTPASWYTLKNAAVSVTANPHDYRPTFETEAFTTLVNGEAATGLDALAAVHWTVTDTTSGTVIETATTAGTSFTMTQALTDGHSIKVTAYQVSVQNVTSAAQDLSFDFVYYSAGELAAAPILTSWGIENFAALPNYGAHSAIATPSGRVIYRHTNGKGSIVVNDRFGVIECVFYADAQYRSRADKTVDSSGADITDIMNLDPYYDGTNYFYNNASNEYISGSTNGVNVSESENVGPITDAQLQTRFAALSVETSAAKQCDLWLDAGGSPTAISYTRGLTDIFSGGLNIPLAYQGAVGFIEGNYLDNLDPTVKDYPANALGKYTNFNRWLNGSFVWVCSEFSAENALAVGYDGTISKPTKTLSYSVLPVYEIGYFYQGNYYTDKAAVDKAKLYAEMRANAPAGLAALGIQSADDLPGYANDNSLLYTPSGRLIYRHANKEGSVMVLDRFGFTECLFIADARHRSRANKNMKPSGADISTLPNIQNYYRSTETNYLYNNNFAQYIAGNNTGYNVSGLAEIGAISDAQLQNRFGPLYQETTAKDQGDKWLAVANSNGAPTAIQYTRGLTGIFDGGLDVPLTYQASAAYVEGNYIDELDPTVADNPNNALGKYNNDSRWFNGGAVWVDSEYSSANALNISSVGSVTNNVKTDSLSVMPVLELGYFYNGEFISDAAQYVTARYNNANVYFDLDTATLTGSNFNSKFSKVTDLPGYPNIDGSLNTSLNSSRLLYRHINGKGTVILFYQFSALTKLFVADAQYRTTSVFCTNCVDTPLYNNCETYNSYDGGWYAWNASTEKKSALSGSKNESFIDGKWSALSNTLSARENCDVWMRYSDTAAVHYARNLSFDGITNGCDIPNAYELAIIFAESDLLDTLDPTATSCPTYKLGYTATNGRFTFDISSGTPCIWSSTETNADYVRAITCNGYFNRDDYNDNRKTLVRGVLPIREL